jgi:hypothetical protein
VQMDVEILYMGPCWFTYLSVGRTFPAQHDWIVDWRLIEHTFHQKISELATGYEFLSRKPP